MGTHPLIVEVLARQFQHELEEKARRLQVVPKRKRRSLAARIVQPTWLPWRAPIRVPATRVPAGC